MTPKQKAIELVEAMSFTCRECDYEIRAKYCAIRAVDEILESNPNYPEFKENEGTAIRFWELVKLEIQKL